MCESARECRRLWVDRNETNKDRDKILIKSVQTTPGCGRSSSFCSYGSGVSIICVLIQRLSEQGNGGPWQASSTFRSQDSDYVLGPCHGGTIPGCQFSVMTYHQTALEWWMQGRLQPKLASSQKHIAHHLLEYNDMMNWGFGYYYCVWIWIASGLNRGNWRHGRK